jgi:hypothetical protein
MANPHSATTLDQFSAVVQNSKNRLIAIPAAVQRRLGLVRRKNNHILHYSIRRSGGGRWNHHLAYLTSDNEFAIPTDVSSLRSGDRVDVKIHRVHPAEDALHNGGRRVAANAGAMLVELADEAGEDARTDGSQSIDEYLYGNGND